MRLLAALAALMLVASTVSAQTTDKPLFSKDRASLAAGIDYAAWGNPKGVSVTDFKKEFEASLYGAYVLTPRFTLAGSASWLTDSRAMRYRIGIRTVIWKGRD